MHWKVSTNKSKFDWKGAREHFRTNGELILYQSKGRATMKHIPLVGDEVTIVSDKKEVLKGIVIESFQEGIEHLVGQCPFSKGENNEHRENNNYATIQITSLGDMHPNCGVQRTWSKYNQLSR